MFDLLDIPIYAVVLGFEFAALCAITKVARGWAFQLLGLAGLVGFNALMEWWYCAAAVPLQFWLSVCFAVGWPVFLLLVGGLSRESRGRRVFLATTYGAYSIFHLSVFHVITYRNVFGLSDGWAVAMGTSVVAMANLAFIFWVLPQVPRDDQEYPWKAPCLAVSALFALLYVCGVWPISILEAPVADCVPFMVVSGVCWVVFPYICRSLRKHLHNVEVERGLASLTIEMQERRRALDQARRLRHDQRHHRVQLAEYLLRGQCDRALAYLRELDEEAAEMPMKRLVWCENETVNAILSGCARRAEARGVTLEVVTHVERTVFLPDTEIVAVVANLIENAIDACGRDIPIARDRTVRVTLRQREHGVGILVSNPVPRGFSLSSKGFPCAEPGIGMESVRRVVERHRGEWTYSLADDLLSCQVVLMMG